MKKVNKKINYVLKLVLLLCMVFAEVASPVKVLADELIQKYNFDISLNKTTDKLDLISNGTKELENTNTYIIEVTRSFEYADGKTYESDNVKEYYNVLGSELSNGIELQHKKSIYNGVSYVNVLVYELIDNTINLSTYTNEDYKNLLTTDKVVKLDSDNVTSFEEQINNNNTDFTYKVTGDNVTGVDDEFTVSSTLEKQNLVNINLNVGIGNLNPYYSYFAIINVNDKVVDFVQSENIIYDFNNLLGGKYDFKIDILEFETNKIVSSLEFTIISELENRDNIKDFIDNTLDEYNFMNYTTLSDEEKKDLGNDYRYLDSFVGSYFDSMINDDTYRLNSLYSFVNEEELYHVVYANNLKGAFNNEDDSYKASDVLEILKDIFNRNEDIIRYEVIDNKGNKVDEDSFITNGMKLRMFLLNQKVEYDIQVFGEVNGGLVDETDLKDLITKILNDELTFYERINLDLNYDEELDVKDVSRLGASIANETYEYEAEDINDELSLVASIKKTNYRVGDTFEVELALNGFNNNYLNAIEGYITYDKELLRLDEVKVLDETFVGNTLNNRMMYATTKTYATDEVTFVKLTFTALKEGTDTISVNNFGTYQDGELITLCNSNDLELTIDRALHTDKTLKSLTSSYGYFDKEFNPDTLEYTLYVDSYVGKVTLSGEVNDIYATVEGLGEYTLTNNVTEINIDVTAENGSVQTYTVKVVKVYKSSNNNLSNLIITGHEIEFDKDTLEYTINVDANANELDISALVEDPKAWAKIEGNENFKEGENIVTIKVYAEDGTTKTYTVKVNKAKKDASPLTVEEVKDEKLSTEKIIIIVLIVLVVIGLLYLIFKKDDEDAPKIEQVKPKKEEKPSENNNNNKNKKK